MSIALVRLSHLRLALRFVVRLMTPVFFYVYEKYIFICGIRFACMKTGNLFVRVPDEIRQRYRAASG